ncbi:MAG: tetratricopeptide repeat protein [Candidatus Thermoplasmatota archaeon]|jgi:tetratricopeptide (TPR) repeat protein|nr:tetratricopeptide repeat protein [Candidatus Sysuiplasma jiujiangense]MBX8639865.1 tetratricopeptide repeat protein [Candidatus Sysuiplasma jiujiangense]MBX8641879.1 tetratricopeptide repeat protein [Candidatus Sysuiplasma jiujiangense]MCL4317773.1 tetratricopeptide repeat protein [Candidatus Thermoplasmatota archaeon]MCL5254126.1 tetratricopeptide repeat protein [Candidatus Thermoplasmatota archaeon]
MAYDIEFGCRALINVIVSRETRQRMAEGNIQKLPEKRLLEYINSLIDLGWVKEERGDKKDSDYVVYAFTEKGRRIYENPSELLNLSDAEQEHVSLLRRLDALKRDDSISMMPQTLMALSDLCLGNGRYDSALMYAMDLHKRAEELKSTFFVGEASILMGRVENARGELESSLKYFINATDAFNRIGEVSREADSLRYAGGVLLKMGDYKQAMMMFEQSKDKFFHIRHMMGVAKAKANLGILHSLTKNYDTAENYWKNALEFFEALEDKESQTKILNNLGAMLIMTKKYDEAVNYLRKAITISREDKNKYSECIGILNFAYANAKLGKYEIARQAVDSINNALKEGFDTYLLAYNELVMAIYTTYRGSWNEAEKRFLAAIRFATTSGNAELISECHEEYGRALMQKNERERAATEFTASVSVSESIAITELRKGLSNGT